MLVSLKFSRTLNRAFCKDAICILGFQLLFIEFYQAIDYSVRSSFQK